MKCVLVYDMTNLMEKIKDIHCTTFTRNNIWEWFLFNANTAIFQLYHGENKWNNIWKGFFI